MGFTDFVSDQGLTRMLSALRFVGIRGQQANPL